MIVALDALLQVGQFAGEFGMTGQHLAKLNKGAHDHNVDLHGALAPQHAGEHSNALLGEGVRQIATPAKVRT